MSACAEIVEYTSGRQACLIFASGVKHGRHIVEVLSRQHGIECGFVSGETPIPERDATLGRFRRGELKYLCNMNVLTTGFCILLEPLKADAIGLAVIAGVCPVRVDVQEESDTFAEVQDDDATQLKSGGSGSATILWKESGTGENKWTVVRLGDSQPVIRKAEMIDTLRQGDGELPTTCSSNLAGR